MNATLTIALTPVESSQIEAIGHDAASNILAIRFKSRGNGQPGPLYHYAGFTADDFAAFQAAESVGSHFYRTIKPFPDKYPYTRIAEPVKDGDAA